MAKIVKNLSENEVSWGGNSMPPTSQYELQPVDVMRFLSDQDFKQAVIDGVAVINDGFVDMSEIDGILYLMSWAPDISRLQDSQGNEAEIDDGRIKVLVSHDTAANVGNVPAGTISSTNVQSALNELDAEKTPITRTITAGAGLTGGGNLSADRTIAMPNIGTPGTYGSSYQIPVVTTDTQGRVASIAPVTVDKLYDHWHGTTQYNASQLRKYTNILNTDAQGRVTVILTETGSGGGPALFASLLSVQACGDSPSNSDPLQAPFFFIETISATQVVFRGARGVSRGILIGGTVNTIQYVGSNIPCYIEITGVKP